MTSTQRIGVGKGRAGYGRGQRNRHTVTEEKGKKSVEGRKEKGSRKKGRRGEKGRGGGRRAEEKDRGPGKVPQKTERPTGTQREGEAAWAGTEESFSRTPPRLFPPLPSLPSGAPPCPARPEAQSARGQVRGSLAQWAAAGPPPRALIGRRRAGRALLTSSLGIGGPTRSRRARPGTPPAQRPRREPGPERARAGLLGREGREARGTAGPARAPGALRGQPRSRPAPSPCPAADLVPRLEGGPALHGPGC